jgi:hypothetical protein
MFFGVWNKARANKENIVYAIVTIFLLERVRTGWNRVDERGRKKGIDRLETGRRQNNLVVKASLLYALPFVLPIVKYIYRSIEELSWSVQGLVLLKNTWVFFGVVALTECFLAIVIYNLLMIYVERMNAAIGFFTKIGRNIWDGSRMAVQVSGDVGSKVVGGVRSAATSAWSSTRLATKRHTARAWSLTKAVAVLPARTLPVTRGIAAGAGQRFRALYSFPRRSKAIPKSIGSAHEI